MLDVLSQEFIQLLRVFLLLPEFFFGLSLLLAGFHLLYLYWFPVSWTPTHVLDVHLLGLPSDRRRVEVSLFLVLLP